MTRCVLVYMLEAVAGGLCLLRVLAMLEELKAPKVMHDVLLCLLEVLDVSKVLEMPEVMRCVLLCVGRVGRGRGDGLCAALLCWWLRRMGSVSGFKISFQLAQRLAALRRKFPRVPH